MQAIFSQLKTAQLVRQNAGMSFFHQKLQAHLDSIGLSFYRLQFLAEINSSAFTLWKRGDRKPSVNELKKLAAVDSLGLSYGTLLMWKLVDEFGVDAVSEMISLAEKELGSRSQKGSSTPLE